MGERLSLRAPRVLGSRERREHVVVEEVGEGTVPHVVEEAGDPKRLDDEPLRRRPQARVGVGERLRQRRVELAAPQARLVHDAEAVGEPGVLRRREDPPGALELADPPQPLEPRRVEEVLLGGVLRRQAGGVRLRGREPFRQLDVAVDRVADEVDGGEAGRAHDRIVLAWRRRGRADRQGTQMPTGALGRPTLPARSRARTMIRSGGRGRGRRASGSSPSCCRGHASSRRRRGGSRRRSRGASTSASGGPGLARST